MRTVLRRLEDKGYVNHTIIGRTYIYRAAKTRAAVAAGAVRLIIERFCRGSAESLITDMVEHGILSVRQLEGLTQKIAQHKTRETRA